MSETPRDILREALQERRPLTEDLLESYEARMARAVWVDRAQVVQTMQGDVRGVEAP